MERYRDIHKLMPSVRLKINRVGVKGVRKQLVRECNGKLEVLNVKIDAYIDIPATLKGAHISRNLEAINEIIEESIKLAAPTNVIDLEAVAARSCLCLPRHLEIRIFDLNLEW